MSQSNTKIVTFKSRRYANATSLMHIIAPKVGPLGMAPRLVVQTIREKTADWDGTKVQIQLTINTSKQKVEHVEAKPSTSSYIIQSLKEPVTKEKEITHNGNLTLQDVIEIARKTLHKSRSKTLSGRVLEVLGTCLSVGCNVEGECPRIIQEHIRSGLFAIPEK